MLPSLEDLPANVLTSIAQHATVLRHTDPTYDRREFDKAREHNMILSDIQHALLTTSRRIRSVMWKPIWWYATKLIEQSKGFPSFPKHDDGDAAQEYKEWTSKQVEQRVLDKGFETVPWELYEEYKSWLEREKKAAPLIFEELECERMAA